MSDGFNGWSSWNAWNVALWLHNDEPNYRLVMKYIRNYPDLSVCAAKLQLELDGDTDDGAIYDYTSIKEAIEEDHEEYWNE